MRLTTEVDFNKPLAELAGFAFWDELDFSGCSSAGISGWE